MQHIDYSTLPPGMQDGARRYIERGDEVGHFLTAVFSSDLVGAYSRADETNTLAMRAWASFLWNQAPLGCWGSAEAVQRWQSHQGLAGLDAYLEKRESRG